MASLLLLSVPHATHASTSPPLHHRTVARHAVDPLLRLQLARLTRGSRPAQRLASVQVPIEVDAQPEVAADIVAMGGHVEAVAGHIIAATVPAKSVSALAHLTSVNRVFAAQRLHPKLDRSVPEIRAPQAWALTGAGALAITGTHVLIGDVDSGIDYHNADFKNPDGSTRIKYIWDQTTDGKAPAGFSFGYECDSASIQSGACLERDTDGHGTHVMGIAAGNGRSSNPAREIGVAPTADIIMVKSDLREDHVIAAWKYLIDKAHALGEPVVINNSFGGQLSPHDGSAPDSQAADALAGPGRIFVAAAGNEGGKGFHADGSVVQGGTSSLTVNAHGRGGEMTFLLSYPKQDAMTVSLTDAQTGESFGPVSPGDSITDTSDRARDRTVTIDATESEGANQTVLVDLNASGSTQDLAGQWRVDVSGTRVTDAGRYNAWLDGTNDQQTFSSPDESDTIADPADATNVIAVGNYATTTQWTGSDGQTYGVCDVYLCVNGTLAVGDIKASSSRGPTADGRQKPDISAPGTMITSSLSGDASICSGQQTDNCIDPGMVTPDRRNMVESGTSMSSPHAAGVVALMLQANPNLDQQQATAILRSTARHDTFTGTAPWTPAFGAGKVDAYAAVEAALQSPRTSAAPTAIPATAAAVGSPPAAATQTPKPGSPASTAPRAQIVALRVNRKGSASGWQVLTTRHAFPARQPVTLSIYIRYSHIPARQVANVTWTVYLSGKRVMQRSLSHPAAIGKVAWDHVTLKPVTAGTYRFRGEVRLGKETVSQVTSFIVTAAH